MSAHFKLYIVISCDAFYTFNYLNHSKLGKELKWLHPQYEEMLLSLYAKKKNYTDIFLAYGLDIYLTYLQFWFIVIFQHHMKFELLKGMKHFEQCNVGVRFKYKVITTLTRVVLYKINWTDLFSCQFHAFVWSIYFYIFAHTHTDTQT